MNLDELMSQYENEIYEIKILTDYVGYSENINGNVAMALDKAKKAILNYTGWVEFNNNYHSAWLSLAIAYLNKDKVVNKSANGEKMLKQKTLGDKSETYENNIYELDSYGLTESVKAMLPLPKLRCF